MSIAQEFHEELKAWSRIKHALLEKYLTLFVGKLGRSGEHVYCVDGFAGQGRYGDAQEGSPLIAARKATNHPQTSRLDVLRCINVEEKAETFANLEKHTREFVQAGVVTNLHGTFEDHLDDILRQVGRSPAFFFIDPFGTASAEFSTLQRIAQRPGKTEALVRFDDTRVKRLIRWAHNHRDSDNDRRRLTAARFSRRTLDLTSEEAIQSFLQDEPDARQKLIEGYVEEVLARGIFAFGIPYPIRNPGTGGHRYFLVHFCNHEDGFCYMANFMAEVERSQQGATSRRQAVNQGDLFGPASVAPPVAEQPELFAVDEHIAKQVEQKKVGEIVAALPAELSRLGFQGRQVENRKIYAAIVRLFRYSSTRKEWIKALRQLQETGVLTISEGTGDNQLTRVLPMSGPPTRHV